MTGYNAPAYDVQKPSGRCALTGREILPREPYVAVLVEEGPALKRLDVCQEAWNPSVPPAGLLAFWKSVFPEPGGKKKLFVDDDVLMNLLRRLADDAQPQRLAFRFVLALILLRKKLLRYDRSERREAVGPDGAPLEQIWWVLTPKLDLSKGPMGKWNEQETLHVLDPRLDEAAVRQITDQLGEILRAEL